jgi:hypothetical protein
MEAFLEMLHVVLPAIRVDMFLSRARSGGTLAVSRDNSVERLGGLETAEAFELHAARAGLTARAELVGGEFIVKSGSRARANWSGVEYATYRELYRELVEAGVLVQDGEHCLFTRDYAFPSPSAASSVVLGRSSSGPKEWRHTATGLSYKEWEARMLARENEVFNV